MGGLIFRKRIKLDDTAANVSKDGVSISRKIGRFITANSHGQVSIRIAPGLSWRFGARRGR